MFNVGIARRRDRLSVAFVKFPVVSKVDISFTTGKITEAIQRLQLEAIDCNRRQLTARILIETSVVFPSVRLSLTAASWLPRAASTHLSSGPRTAKVCSCAQLTTSSFMDPPEISPHGALANLQTIASQSVGTPRKSGISSVGRKLKRGSWSWL